MALMVARDQVLREEVLLLRITDSVRLLYSFHPFSVLTPLIQSGVKGRVESGEKEERKGANSFVVLCASPPFPFLSLSPTGKKGHTGRI